MAWIRQQPCDLTGVTPADPHHVKTRGAGGDDVGNVIPLAHHLHEECHRIGILSFQRKRNVCLYSRARKYGQRWLAIVDVP
jgi:hypothetical protein